MAIYSYTMLQMIAIPHTWRVKFLFLPLFLPPATEKNECHFKFAEVLRFRNANSYRTNIMLAHINFAELCKSFFGDICFRHYKYTPSTTAPLPHYYHHHQSSSLNIFPCLSVNSMYFNIRAAWETNTCTEAAHSLQTSRTRGREKEENSKRRRPPAGCIQETNGY